MAMSFRSSLCSEITLLMCFVFQDKEEMSRWKNKEKKIYIKHISNHKAGLCWIMCECTNLKVLMPRYCASQAATGTVGGRCFCNWAALSCIGPVPPNLSGRRFCQLMGQEGKSPLNHSICETVFHHFVR